MKKKMILPLMMAFSLFFSNSMCSPRKAFADLLSDEEEIQELRTKNSKTYQLSNGSFKCVVSADSIHYMTSDGEYEDIDSSIIEETTQQQYRYRNTANSWNVFFSDYLVNQDAVKIQNADTSIAFSIQGGNNQYSVQKAEVLSECELEYYTEISKDERAVVYQNVFDDVDVVYSARTGAVKEDIVLKDSSSQNCFDFILSLEGVVAIQNQTGIAFLDTQDNEVFRLEKLYMIDSNGRYSEEVSANLYYEDGKTFVRIVADESFLKDMNTVYPVVIDPTITITGASNTYDTCVDEQYPSSNYYTSVNLWTGGKTSTNTMRTYIKFDIPSSVSNCIFSATLKLKKNAYASPGIKAYRVTSNWTSSTVTWNNKPSFSTTGATNTCSLYSGDWYQIDVKTMVEHWKNGTYSNYGFLLKEPSETNTDQKTRWYSSDAPSPNKPELVINYVGISCWYSDSYMIGRRTESPTLWYSKLNSNPLFMFVTGMSHAESQWESALGISIISTSSEISSSLKYYGGTKAEIDALGIFPSVPTTDLGLSQVYYSLWGTIPYNGITKNVVIISSSRGYIVDRSDMGTNNYKKTCTHEFGHALGWIGHPSTLQPTWVMQQGILENTVLAENEKKHISQTY